MYKDNILQNNFIQRFKIIKNGVHFHFKKDFGELGGDFYKDSNQSGKFTDTFIENNLSKKKEIFIENIVFKVQI